MPVSLLSSSYQMVACSIGGPGHRGMSAAWNLWFELSADGRRRRNSQTVPPSITDFFFSTSFFCVIALELCRIQYSLCEWEISTCGPTEKRKSKLCVVSMSKTLLPPPSLNDHEKGKESLSLSSLLSLSFSLRGWGEKKVAGFLLFQSKQSSHSV